MASVRHAIDVRAVAKLRVGVFRFLEPRGEARNILLLRLEVQRDAGFEERVDGELGADNRGGAMVSVEFEEIKQRF